MPFRLGMFIVRQRGDFFRERRGAVICNGLGPDERMSMDKHYHFLFGSSKAIAGSYYYLLK
jgi:hypothetical protein